MATTTDSYELCAMTHITLMPRASRLSASNSQNSNNFNVLTLGAWDLSECRKCHCAVPQGKGVGMVVHRVVRLQWRIGADARKTWRMESTRSLGHRHRSVFRTAPEVNERRWQRSLIVVWTELWPGVHGGRFAWSWVGGVSEDTGASRDVGR